MVNPVGGLVQIDFSLGIGEGRLDASIAVPTGNVNFTQFLPVLHTLESALIDSAARLVEESGQKISCRAGCGACCRQMVPISIFEAEALGQWVRTLSATRQDELRARFHRVLLALKDSGILQHVASGDWFEDPESMLETAIDYFRQGMPCPFLEEESCSIHSIRPLKCREYLVTSPAELCKEPSKSRITAVELPMKLSAVLYRMGGEIEANGRGWIPLIFLFAWMESGAEPGKSCWHRACCRMR